MSQSNAKREAVWVIYSCFYYQIIKSLSFYFCLYLSHALSLIIPLFSLYLSISISVQGCTLQVERLRLEKIFLSLTLVIINQYVLFFLDAVHLYFYPFFLTPFPKFITLVLLRIVTKNKKNSLI